MENDGEDHDDPEIGGEAGVGVWETGERVVVESVVFKFGEERFLLPAMLDGVMPKSMSPVVLGNPREDS